MLSSLRSCRRFIPLPLYSTLPLRRLEKFGLWNMQTEYVAALFG